MIQLDNIEGFQWDEANTLKIQHKHGVGPMEAEQVFLNDPLLLLDDTGHSVLEKRFHAFGKSLAGRLLQVSFTLRNAGKLIRVISARPMSRKERVRYDQET